MVKKIFILLMSLLVSSQIAAADLNSPIGRWVTISDKTHDRSGIVQIYEQGGKLYGKILKIFPGSGRNPADRCVKCPGNFKDKPVEGLTFLWGFERQPDGTWTNGQILDPKEGNVYKGKLTLTDQGKKLDVRGYWAFFWRTQTWLRE